MCLSIPYQIKSIKGKIGTVQSYDKKNKKISLNLITNLKVGDWILSQNNFAVQKISNKQAKQIFSLYKTNKGGSI